MALAAIDCCQADSRFVAVKSDVLSVVGELIAPDSFVPAAAGAADGLSEEPVVHSGCLDQVGIVGS